MTGAAARPRPDTEQIELGLLLEGILRRYNYDFHGYSKASVLRRVRAAMAKHGLATISEVQERVLHQPDFFPKLLQFMTVSTTEMFRDPGFFRALRERVLPHLRSYPTLKIWVAGCSTGEEVYSLAILLEEEGLLDRALIYATDINPASLRFAEAGIYRADDVRRYTQSYQRSGGRRSLADYYTAAYEAAAFDARLRANVVFADHSLATDSVFSEVQFVSCRNVLIYFERGMQDRAVALFHESLCHRGFLGLGEKESLRFPRLAQDFEPLEGGEKIYRKVC